MTEDAFASVSYTRNPMKEVIARIDFVSPIEAVQTELSKEVAKAALGRFPIDEPRPVIAQELLISSKHMQTRKTEFTEWNFYGRTREKRLVITPQALFVSFNKYNQYEAFREEFSTVVETFFSAYNNAQPSRLGLRYINEIKPPTSDPLKWDEFIDSKLLGMFSYEVEQAQPSRIFHNLEFSFDEFNLRFQFGVHNPDYPAPIRQKVFVLDFDAYYKGLLEPPEVARLLDSYHAEIQKLFESSITEKTREWLNRQDDV